MKNCISIKTYSRKVKVNVMFAVLSQIIA